MPPTFRNFAITTDLLHPLNRFNHTAGLSLPKFLQDTKTRSHRVVRELCTTKRHHFAQPVFELLPTKMITQPLTLPFLSRTRAKADRHALPASWMRCGTSKGLFIDRQHLPKSPEEWQPWLMAAMGSKNGDRRQLDGIGGATSTTSKVAVVAPSSRVGIDIEYTFAQVAVGKEHVDYSGNCGNIASGVGPFALEQGMIDAKLGEKEVCVKAPSHLYRSHRLT